MFSPVSTSDNEPAEESIDLAPLIDTVFILLVFFLVTASFSRTTGIEIDAPTATNPVALPDESLRIVITPRGRFYLDGSPASTLEVQRRVKEFTAARPDQPVVIISDRATPSGDLIQLMDLVREAGAQNLAVAARDRQGE